MSPIRVSVMFCAVVLPLIAAAVATRELALELVAVGVAAVALFVLGCALGVSRRAEGGRRA